MLISLLSFTQAVRDTQRDRQITENERCGCVRERERKLSSYDVAAARTEGKRSTHEHVRGVQDLQHSHEVWTVHLEGERHQRHAV